MSMNDDPQDEDPSTTVREFLAFVLSAKSELETNLVAENDPDVAQIKSVAEEHYVDDRGQPAMYQRLESALYDNARELVTLWRFFPRFHAEQLRVWMRMLKLEHEGLLGDRHPRKVFDRSPFGIVALVCGSITVWMTVLKTYSGDDDLSTFLEAVRFNWVAGSLWIVGLFIVLWFILKTVRNNRQVALVSCISRALELHLAQLSAFRDTGD